MRNARVSVRHGLANWVVRLRPLRTKAGLSGQGRILGPHGARGCVAAVCTTPAGLAPYHRCQYKRWVYDGHDDWFVPRSGTRIETEAKWLATAPQQPSGFAQARLTSTSFLPVGRGGRVFLALVGSTASDDRLSPLHQSTLGGPFRLGAFERDQLRGVRTGYAGTGYLHQLGRMPDLLGGPIYVGAWLESGWIEAGKAFPTASHTGLRNVSAGLLVDTLLGALFASTSFGDDGPRFRIGLGRPLW